MTFRRTRRSDNHHTWWVSVISLVGFLFGLVLSLAVFSSGSLWPKIFMSGVTLLFGIVFVFSMDAILFPREWELVVDAESIRWGVSSKPKRQKKLPVAKIVRVIYDKSDGKLLVDMGGIQRLPVADHIVFHPDDQAALVEYLRENFPGLAIEIRCD